MAHPVSPSNRPFGTYRGSRRRLRRITWRGNWSIEMWILVAIMAFVALVGVPWLMRHASVHHHVAGAFEE